jgi:hypothetical protein
MSPPESTNRRMTALAVFLALMARSESASALGRVKGARSVVSRTSGRKTKGLDAISRFIEEDQKIRRIL